MNEHSKHNELSIKVLRGPKQIEREQKETVRDRFDRLQRSLRPLRKGKQVKKGIHYIRRTKIHDFTIINILKTNNLDYMLDQYEIGNLAS
jgi:hypothetical protein